MRRAAVIGCAALAAVLVAVALAGATPAFAAGGGLPVGAITVSPAPVALHDNQVVTVSGSGFAPRAAVVVAECSVQAATQGPDFCNERFVAVAPADLRGSFSAQFRVHPVIETAAGTVDCRTTACVLAAENLGDRSQLTASPVTFAPGGGTSSPPASGRHRPSVPRSGSVAVARPGAAAHVRVLASLAAKAPDRRIGEVVSTPTRGVPRRPVSGEGLVALTMSAPGTSWESARATSVVVQVAIDGGEPQTMVLFAGARPFTYQGFTGPLRTGPHRVSVQVRPDLSAASGVVPTAVVQRVQLVVASRGPCDQRRQPTRPTRSPIAFAGRAVPGRRTRQCDSSSLALAYAPVLYDRRVVAASDTPELTYATVRSLPDGAHRISYVVVWSNEDAGTGFVPFLLRGGFGRMSDIEDVISLTVDRRGVVHDPVYLGCTTCGPGFPENRTALDETFTPFRGQYFGHHPILRVATGNNDVSDSGRTSFRFQQGLAAPPLPGETREGAMDRNPWTYRITDQEVKRERDDFSTDPGSPAPGDSRQYLIVELDAAAANVAAVGVDIQLVGDSRTYRNDFDTTYPLYAGGLGRTVVKLPLAAVDRPIATLRLRLQPSSSAAPSIVVHALRVLQYAHGVIVQRRSPPAEVVEAP